MTHKKRSYTKTSIKFISGSILLWLVVAYLVAPIAWFELLRSDPSNDDSPRITHTSDHHPGDPINVALIGTATQIQEIMKAAKWFPAQALGLESDLKIAADTILSRPDESAPVSSLYLFGRKEDLAFEQPVGDNPRHRHHVRFWKTDKLSDDGRPRWIGSAVYDKRVGLSRTTGQITHVTDADVDTERNYLFDCLEKSEQLKAQSIVKGFHATLQGFNGGGDPWRTDGDLYVGAILNN
ncbi:MAG: LssY C-terminal domain-containing protein [Planctomycetota bacterium]|nr:LssY C-terminal domain-containing protein [Planctomycetota bacterium]